MAASHITLKPNYGRPTANGQHSLVNKSIHCFTARGGYIR